MHYFVFIEIQGLYCTSLERQHCDWAETPLVIHCDKIVIDSNLAAKKANVWNGMPLSEAKAILENGRFISWEEEPFRQIQTEWLDILCEFSDVIEPKRQHDAWIDLSQHPDPEEIAFKVLQRIESKLNLQVRMGMAKTKWLAELACMNHLNSCSNMLTEQILLREPCIDPAGFLESLHTSKLLPVEQSILQKLEFLGYRTIGQVAEVPLSVLSSQFGDIASFILKCANGGHFEPIVGSYPPATIAKRIQFEGVVEDKLVLDHALQVLAQQLADVLKKDDSYSKQVLLTIETESGYLELRRKFVKPICNYASALASLRLMADSIREPSLGLRVRLEDVTRSKRVQHELLGRASNYDRNSSIASAFQHVRTVFGDSSIVAGSEVSEPRRKRVLKAWKDATGWM